MEVNQLLLKLAWRKLGPIGHLQGFQMNRIIFTCLIHLHHLKGIFVIFSRGHCSTLLFPPPPSLFSFSKL